LGTRIDTFKVMHVQKWQGFGWVGGGLKPYIPYRAFGQNDGSIC
jgi:hypothetical protein